MSYHIGIDVGGTTTTVALGSADRKVLHISDQFDSQTSAGPQGTIRAILDHVLDCLQRVGASIDQLGAVGLATPGPATLDGILLNTPNFDPELWNGFTFRATLEEELHERSSSANVRYIGDGQAAALGEYAIRTGALSYERGDAELPGNEKQRLSTLFMVIVGTGLGGGEVQDGMAVRGLKGRAGHAGHIFLPPYAFRYEHDRNLQVGNACCTLESAVSLTSLAHQLQYRLTLENWRDHPLNARADSIREKAKELRELAAAGDALALELFDDQARALGIGLLSVNYLGDYDLLVIGGGVCDLSPNLRERYRIGVEQAYREYSLDGFRDLDRVEYSVCGDDAPVIGSLACAYSPSNP